MRCVPPPRDTPFRLGPFIVGVRQGEIVDQTTSRRGELIHALGLLKRSGIDFRGSFSTSKRELVQVEDQLLKVTELLELVSIGQLTREGIRNFLSTNKRSAREGCRCGRWLFSSRVDLSVQWC